MGLYDVSAEIKLIREKKWEKSYFLWTFFRICYWSRLLTLKVEEAKNYLKTMILLSPPCYFEHVTNYAIIFLKQFVSVLEVDMLSIYFLQIISYLQK
jgi:hypothetical protein